MDRRLFLHTAAGTVVAMACVTGRSQTLRLHFLNDLLSLIAEDAVKSLVFADAESQRLRSNSAQMQSTLTLPAIYVRSKSGGRASSIQKDIKKILDQGTGSNRETLIASTDYFRVMEDPARYAHAFGVGLQVVGAFASVFNPVAGIVLSTAGAMGEDIWKAVASGRDLTKNPFIQDDSGEKGRVLRATLDAGAANYDSPAFRSVVDSPLLRERTGLDFSQTREALLEKLPEKLRAVVIEAINQDSQDLRNNISRQEQAVGSILNRFKGQLDEFDRQVKDYGELLRRQHEREEREAARARIVALQNDVNAGISIATFVLGRAMGDKKKSQEIGQVLAGVASAGFSIATGNYLGAISTCLGMLDGTAGNSMAPVMQFLKQFGEKLDQLRTEMHDRFDRLERQQQEMFVELGKIYQAVNEGFSVTNERLRQLSNRFESYWTIADEDKRRDAIARIHESFSQAKLVLDAREEGWKTSYLEKLPIVVTHARQEARKSYYRGASMPGAGNLAAEVEARKAADRLVGLVPPICLSVSVNVPSDLVNPFALEDGAEAYMQADLLLGNATTNSGRAKELRHMWDDGVGVRTALNSISSKNVIHKLCDLYAARSGVLGDPEVAPPTTLIGAIHTMFGQWITETLKPRYSIEKLPDAKLFVNDPPREVFYGSFFTQIRVKDSPVDEVLNLGLIEISVGKHEKTHSVEKWTYRRIQIKKGPHAGLVLDGGPNLGYTVEKYLDKPPAERRSFILPMPNFQRTNPVAHSTMEFLEYCEFLRGFYYVTEKALEFPTWLRKRVFNEFIKTWMDTASALRLAAAIGRWRTFDGIETEGQTDVRNISLLTTQADAIDWIEQMVKADSAKYIATPGAYSPATADPRQSKLYVRIAERVRADLNAILVAPVMPDTKSVPVVDRTLRKLAGYMSAHNIEFPVPPSP